MAVPRSLQLHLANPGWVHCVSRCVRRAFLAGEGFEHRRGWIERRLRYLSGAFACEVAAYSVMSNHMHTILRMVPEVAAGWSDREVVVRWLQAFPGHWDAEDLADVSLVEVEEDRVERLVNDADWVAKRRERLGSLSWFMRALCEVIARRANIEDDCTGRFWEGRYSSTPLLDQAALVACMAYVDLNPIRAHVAESVETSAHTSAKLRYEDVCGALAAESPEVTGSTSPGNTSTSDVDAEDDAASSTMFDSRGLSVSPSDAMTPGSAMGQAAALKTGERTWLTSIRDLTAHDRATGAGAWTVTEYLRLVEATGRIVRHDKRGAIDAALPDLLARLDPQWGVSRWALSMCGWRQMSGGCLGRRANMQSEAERRGHKRARTRCSLFQVRPPRVA